MSCGIGDLYPFLLNKFGAVDYAGIDIVPELIFHAATIYPDANFSCHDVLVDGIAENYDYVLMSGFFNYATLDADDFLKIVSLTFQHCDKGIGFNFISTHANFKDHEMHYHDPVEVISYCLKNVTKKIFMHHHYNRCDVAVFLYR